MTAVAATGPDARAALRNPWLVAGGMLSLAAALLHLAIIAGGPDWYRFFGAGEKMARAAEFRSWRPAAFAIAIAGVLASWSAFAFSGAGLIGRLPLLRTALLLISAIYLLRGLAILPLLALRPGLVDSFAIWSSLIVLIYGVVHAVGTRRAWSSLSRKEVR